MNILYTTIGVVLIALAFYPIFVIAEKRAIKLADDAQNLRDKVTNKSRADVDRELGDFIECLDPQDLEIAGELMK